GEWPGLASASWFPCSPATFTSTHPRPRHRVLSRASKKGRENLGLRLRAKGAFVCVQCYPALMVGLLFELPGARSSKPDYYMLARIRSCLRPMAPNRSSKSEQH